MFDIHNRLVCRFLELFLHNSLKCKTCLDLMLTKLFFFIACIDLFDLLNLFWIFGFFKHLYFLLYVFCHSLIYLICFTILLYVFHHFAHSQVVLIRLRSKHISQKNNQQFYVLVCCVFKKLKLRTTF